MIEVGSGASAPMMPMLVATPAAPPAAPAATPLAQPAERPARPKPRLWEGPALGLHRLADRFDRLPPEFGCAGEIDEAEARAVVGEWIRCLRLWADYSPEQVFALKYGAVVLIAALIGLWVFISVLS